MVPSSFPSPRLQIWVTFLPVNKHNPPVLTAGSPPKLHSPGASLYYSLLRLYQCLPLPRDLSACRLQFILHCTRRIFQKGGGEVSDLVTTQGAQGHKSIQPHKGLPSWSQPLPTSLTVAPNILLSYLHPQILHPNHIRNPWHSSKLSLPFGPSIPLHRIIPLDRMPSMPHGAFARSLLPHQN